MPENIGSAYVQIVPSMDGVSEKVAKELDVESAAPGKKVGGKFSTALKTAIGGAVGVATAAAGAITAASGAVVGMATKTAEYGDMIDKNSQKMGVSAEFYQEWDAVLQHSGTSMDAMGATFKKLATTSQNASKDQQAAFEALGMSMDDVANMSAEDLFKNVVSGLQGMEEGTERTAIATQLLGRGATEMGALFNTSAEDTQKMIDTVHDLGGVMSNETVKDSAAFQDAMQDMKTSFSSLSRNVAAELLPHMTTFVGFLTDNMPQISEAIRTVVDAVMPVVRNAMSWVVAHMPQIQAVVKTVFSVTAKVINALAPVVQKVFALIGTAVNKLIVLWKGPFGDTVKATVANAIVGIKNMYTSVSATFKRIGTTLVNLREKFHSVFEKIRSTVTSVVDKIKGIFNFTWSLPKLKTPKFSISPDGWKVGDLLKGVIPRLSVKWNAEGGIFNSPSIVGYGVGEAGAEAIVPLGKFWGKLDALTESVRSGAGSGAGAITVQVNMDGQTIAQRTVDYINEQTIVFNMSPLLT